MLDRRLLGVWRSDKRRTLRELQARRDIPQKSQQVLAGLLGKLELRFTETRCYSTFNGRTSSVPYFDGSRFWINVGTGIFREFFTRVKQTGRSR